MDPGRGEFHRDPNKSVGEPPSSSVHSPDVADRSTGRKCELLGGLLPELSFKLKWWADEITPRSAGSMGLHLNTHLYNAYALPSALPLDGFLDGAVLFFIFSSRVMTGKRQGHMQASPFGSS